MVEGVDLVVAGKALLSPTVTRGLIERRVEGPDPRRIEQEMTGLTEREHEVLEVVAHGATNDEIAAALSV